MNAPLLYGAGMRNTLLLLSALLLSPLSASAQEPVTFTYAPVKAKAKQTLSNTHTQNMLMQFNITVGGKVLGAMSGENLMDRTKTAYIKKWKKKKRSAIFSYQDNGSYDKQTDPEGKTQERKKPYNLDGLSFAIEWSAKTDEVTITTAEGEPVSESQQKLVMKDWKGLPTQRPAGPLENLLGKAPLTPGDELVFDKATLDQMMNMDDGDEEFTLQNPKLVFKEVREHAGVECGVFELSMTMVGAKDGMHMNMNMAGEFIVGVDNLQLHHLKMSGPLTMNAEQTKGEAVMTMNGSGQAKFAIIRTYGD